MLDAVDREEYLESCSPAVVIETEDVHGFEGEHYAMDRVLVSHVNLAFYSWKTSRE